jgi:hypothetical protein
MNDSKTVAVAVEFAEKVALARMQFKNQNFSQLELDWHESRWKTFQSSIEIDQQLDKLTDELSSHWKNDQLLRQDPSNSMLFLNRAVITRNLNQIRHKLFSLLSEIYKE